MVDRIQHVDERHTIIANTAHFPGVYDGLISIILDYIPLPGLRFFEEVIYIYIYIYITIYIL